MQRIVAGHVCETVHAFTQFWRMCLALEGLLLGAWGLVQEAMLCVFQGHCDEHGDVAGTCVAVYVVFNVVWNMTVLLSVKHTGALATFIALKAIFPVTRLRLNRMKRALSLGFGELASGVDRPLRLHRLALIGRDRAVQPGVAFHRAAASKHRFLPMVLAGTGQLGGLPSRLQ